MEENPNQTYSEDEAFNLLQKVTHYRNIMPEAIAHLNDNLIKYYSNTLDSFNFEPKPTTLDVEIPKLEETTSLCKIDEDLESKIEERMKIISVLKALENDPMNMHLLKKD